MASIAAIAQSSFAACEIGKGWEVCKAYCTAGATFSAHAEPARRCDDTCAICGLDENPADSPAGRTLQSEVHLA
jgi:hypothetical protein